MPFNTKSYLAGVGTVVAALTIGFSGGFLLAPTTEHVEQNRLQRVTSAAAISSPAPQEANTARPEITEARSIALIPAAVPAPSTQPSARTAPIPVMARADEAAPAIAEINAEKMRAAETKAADRKRAREQRSAERRKQREIEAATVAVKRMLRDREPQQVADRTASSRFGFFGED